MPYIATREKFNYLRTVVDDHSNIMKTTFLNKFKCFCVSILFKSFIKIKIESRLLISELSDFHSILIQVLLKVFFQKSF